MAYGPKSPPASVGVAPMLTSCVSRVYLKCSMWDLSFQTRDQTCAPCSGRWIPIHCATREVPQFGSIEFSCSVVDNSLQPHESQHARPPCPSPTPGVYSNSCPSSRVTPSSHLILCRPLLLLPPIPPSITVFSNEVAKVLEFQLQHQSFQCTPRTDLF